MDVLATFHPAVRARFEGCFPLGPAEPWERGWPAGAGDRDSPGAASTGGVFRGGRPRDSVDGAEGVGTRGGWLRSHSTVAGRVLS
jgi:hypothetical protein